MPSCLRRRKGRPVEVKCDFYIQRLGPMNEVDMDFSMEVYFRQRWLDERLAFTEQAAPVVIPTNHIGRIWLPDLYFPDEKQGAFHDITVPNKALKIFPNGTVRYSLRLTLRLSCNMLLMSFPLDYQDCAVRVSSYSQDTSDLVLSWFDDDPVEYSGQELTLPQFHLLKISPGTCLTSYKTGNFPCLALTFHLQRQVGFYILQTYIPSILIVMLSWVSFWISKDAVPARISLGVTTVLTMTTQLSTSRSNLMQVSYPKAIDVWYTACMTYVFGAFLEFAFVNVLSRGNKKRWIRHTLRKQRGHDNESFGSPDDVELQDTNLQNTAADLDKVEEIAPHDKPQGRNKRFPGCITAACVDKASRIIFPLSFFLFNVVYWSVYCQKIVWKYFV